MEERAPSISAKSDFKKTSPLLSNVIESPCRSGRVSESESMLINAGLDTAGTNPVVVNVEGPLPSGKKSTKSTVTNEIEPIAKTINSHHV